MTRDLPPSPPPPAPPPPDEGDGRRPRTPSDDEWAFFATETVDFGGRRPLPPSASDPDATASPPLTVPRATGKAAAPALRADSAEKNKNNNDPAGTSTGPLSPTRPLSSKDAPSASMNVWTAENDVPSPGRASGTGPGSSRPPPMPFYASIRRMTRKRKRLRRVARAVYRRFRNRRVHLSMIAVIVGAIAGATALLLRLAELATARFLHGLDRTLAERFDTVHPDMILRIAPGVGLALTIVFVRFILKDPRPASVFSVLRAIKTHGYLRLRHIAGAIGGCALTLGFGGSVGMEAPAIATGSTVGSNLAEAFRMTRSRRALLIGCGAAGGIASIFDAPLAGFLFAMEVLMGGLVVESIVPLLLASVAGNIVGRLLGDKSAAIFAQPDRPAHTLNDLAACAALGVFCGLLSVAFLWIFARAGPWMAAGVRRGLRIVRPGLRAWPDEAVDNKKASLFLRALVAGLLLSVMMHWAPSLYGDGVKSMRMIEAGRVGDLMARSAFASYRGVAAAAVVYALAIPLLKALATSITLGGGGVGGIFIPCLFMGCFAGWGFAAAVNLALGAPVLDPSAYVMAGMAGMVAGVVHAPLTGIFLCVENSGGYSWFVPYIVTGACAYLTHMHFQPYSIYSGGPEAAEAGPMPAEPKRSMRY